ncbi:MAG: PBP1A family penicillin-binding protein [Proteobacteria bacterium]|nr:PBP1A family penicillin-binding protein [Pseudomonadota bacterium]
MFLTKKKTMIKRVAFASILCLLGVLLIGGGFLLVQAVTWYQMQPWDKQIEEIIQYKKPKSTKFYDSKGQLLTESFRAYHHFMTIDDIPKTLIHAVLAIEDQNFYQHHGIDLQGIIRAAWHNLKSRQLSQGGSTITQQLVRHHVLTRDKKIIRKIKEIILAIKLEKKLTKQQILEMYLNHIFLGQNSYGVASAALRFFSRSVKMLQLHEHALIAGLFQAPSRYNPFKHKSLARKRQIAVLKAMVNQGKISQQTYQKYRKKPLRYQQHISGYTKEPHYMYYIDYASREAGKILGVSDLKDKGYKIYTYLDQDVSRLLHESIMNMTPKFAKIEKLNGLNNEEIQAAASVVSLAKGSIVAMIGGRDYTKSNFNRSYQARRAPGSVFKPVIYSYALTQGYKWSDVFYLAPITLADTYRPRSSQREYISETTLLRAFTSSINVTTIEVGKKLGLHRVIDHAQKLGVRSHIKEEYGSLIGQSEVSQLDMIRLYSTFANQGKRIEPVVISHILDADGEEIYRAPPLEERVEKVLPVEINFLMVKAMSSVLKYGTARASAHLASIAAGKTGTSNDAIDNWFCGFTSDYLSVVWVGPESHRALLSGRGAGATLALPIWQRTMESLSQVAGTTNFSVPEGVKRFTIDARYGHAATNGYEAWFLSHHQPPSRPSFLKLLNSPGKLLRGFGHYQ